MNANMSAPRTVGVLGPTGQGTHVSMPMLERIPSSRHVLRNIRRKAIEAQPQWHPHFAVFRPAAMVCLSDALRPGAVCNQFPALFASRVAQSA